MSDKPVGVFVASVLALPLCAVCVVGPAAIGSFLGGIAAWFSGGVGLAAAAAVIVAALAVRTTVRKRGHRKESE